MIPRGTTWHKPSMRCHADEQSSQNDSDLDVGHD